MVLVSAPILCAREGQRLQVRVVETRLEKILLMNEERCGNETPNREATALTVLGVTARESEDLFWGPAGKAKAEIAHVLPIALRTVTKHGEHIFSKLGDENRTCASEVLHRLPPPRRYEEVTVSRAVVNPGVRVVPVG